MTEILGGVKKPDFSTSDWHIELGGGHNHVFLGDLQEVIIALASLSRRSYQN